MITKIKGGRIISGKRIYDNPGLLIEDGMLCSGRECAGPGSAEAGPAEVIDAAGLYITPGFIDIHTHGALMKSFHDGTADSYQTISGFQASHGVTSVVGATSTMPIPEVVRCCRFMESQQGREWKGARVLGLHIEGPFLSIQNKGAHRAEDILSCERKNYEPLLPFAGAIKIITVAPDNDDAIGMIKEFAGRGVTVNGGHDYSYETFIDRAIDAGMTHTTHLFCAMSGWRWTNGKKYFGLTECALEDDRLSVELIADGHHTNARMVRLAYKAKGPDRMCLVSDMAEVGGLPPGDAVYELRTPGVPGSHTILVDNGVAKLPDRSLNAGSITAVDAMLRNAVSWGIPLAHAVEMVTGAPARVIREYSRMGSLDAGKLADITLLNPALDVVQTIVGGKTVYRA
ncbi:MAG: amidohydrolase family protein [Treponema sp.]|nr:amidohydrolase family protein [Treponema sp.]